MTRAPRLGRDVATFVTARADWDPDEVDVGELRRFAREGVLASSRPVVAGHTRAEREVRLPGRTLPVWVFRPDDAPPGPLPTLVWFAGGGFVVGGPDSVADLCAELCVASRCQVVCVGYRLAPEHPWPAGHDDALEALAWLTGARCPIAVDRGAVAVGGDSAGAHVAAHTALRWRGRGPDLAHQVLLYPVVSGTTGTASYRDFAAGYGLTRDQMRWFLATHGPHERPHEIPFDLLGVADLGGVCPAYVVTAECDVLRDEGEAYAAALDAAGVETIAVRYQGMPHGFCQMTAVTSTASAAVAACGRHVGAALRSRARGGDAVPTSARAG